MKALLITVLILANASLCRSQLRYELVTFKLNIPGGTKKLQIKPSSASFTLDFDLPESSLELLPQNEFLLIDSQITQCTMLRIEGLKLPVNELKDEEQRELLKNYSKYELDYLRDELKVEVIDPNDQWVDIKNRKWFIWYFKIGAMPVNVERRFSIQLFASTLVGQNILTLNMPVEQSGDFVRTALIMNAMMEGMKVLGK